MSEADKPPVEEPPPREAPARPESIRFVYSEPQLRPWDPRRHIEETASFLAKGLLYLFGATLAGLFVFMWKDSDKSIELGKTILPIMSTPLALALGYYFGVSSRGPN